MPEPHTNAEQARVAQAYHDRTKHRLDGYAAGPDTLDWDAQPNPFRRYAGAPLTPLPLLADTLTTPWADLFEPGRVVPHAMDWAGLGLLFELSFALSAWKQLGPDRWAVRVNPSSGNLHPTEAWLLCRGVAGVADGVHHYAPCEHALELRGSAPASDDADGADGAPPPQVWVALSSIAWREAWKYGERAFRYVHLDVGHALGALRYAAATLGWRVQPVACGTADLAHALGLDRDADFGQAEREEPDMLLALWPATGQPAQSLPHPTQWHGVPNRLDRHPMYRWPVIDTVTAATRVQAVPPEAPAQAHPDLSRSPHSSHGSHSAAVLIRQRRSAQRFDARARLPLARLWPLLRALHPSHLPWDAWPATPRVHVLVFAHRVDGLTPGAYLLPRSTAGRDVMARTLPAELAAALGQPVPGAPADAPLLRLADNPALAGTLRTLNCHQALGSDAMVGFALLAEFGPWPTAHSYRERLQEAGLLGQVLYLEAEAAGLRGTGIGCFFDDATHQLLGLPESATAGAPLQSVYHFTVGQAVVDGRIATEAPYAHLAERHDTTQHPHPPGPRHDR